MHLKSAKPAWARLLQAGKLSAQSEERLRRFFPRHLTRQIAVPHMNEGVESFIYPGFTGQFGRTAIKTFKDGKGLLKGPPRAFGDLQLADRFVVMSRYPEIFAKPIHLTGRGWVTPLLKDKPYRPIRDALRRFFLPRRLPPDIQRLQEALRPFEPRYPLHPTIDHAINRGIHAMRPADRHGVIYGGRRYGISDFGYIGPTDFRHNIMTTPEGRSVIIDPIFKA